MCNIAKEEYGLVFLTCAAFSDPVRWLWLSDGAGFAGNFGEIIIGPE